MISLWGPAGTIHLLSCIFQAPLNNTFSDSEDDRQRRRRYTRKQSKKAASSPEEPTIDPFIEQYNSTLSAVESITSPSIPATKTSPAKGKAKKSKNDSMPSRPKMIHTQKTRVPVEANEDGRVRHKTRTLITRTQPAEIKSSTGKSSCSYIYLIIGIVRMAIEILLFCKI